MSNPSPAYNIDDLIAACAAGCKGGRDVVLYGKAIKSAASDFGLTPEREVFRFIADGGVDDRQYRDTRPLEWPGLNHGRPVDAYTFYSGPTLCGYLSFFWAVANKWIIKSFKKNKEGDPRNLVFFSALKHLGKLTDGK